MTYLERSNRSIGQGCLTNSKSPHSHVFGIYPTHIKNSTGCFLIDLAGSKYMDFICGLGTNILGYGHPLVEMEVQKYRTQGKSPSLPHILEVEAAEELKGMFPWVERWKFLKSGSEACSAAVRMARATTGKKPILSDGYHGWHDNFASLKTPHPGVLDSKALEMYTEDEDISIIEPVQIDNGEERLKFLRDQEGFRIYDEVITGFRYEKHSVAKSIGTRPDLIVIGKAMANGYPLAAVGGKADVLDGDYFVSSTYAGEISSLAACKAVCKTLKSDPSFNINHLWEVGQEFLDQFNAYAAPLDIRIEGYPTRGAFKGNELNIALFFQEACKAGFIFGKSWFISFSHIPFMKQATKTLIDLLQRMSCKLPALQGEMPRSPESMRFRK